MLGSVLYLSANDGSAQCVCEVGRTVYTVLALPFFQFCEPKDFSCFLNLIVHFFVQFISIISLQMHMCRTTVASIPSYV